MNKSQKVSGAQQPTRKRELGGKMRKDVTSSVTFLRKRQIQGFANCLTAFLRRYKIFCCNEKSYQWLESKLQPFDLSQLPKVFKLSLATFFSKELGQELPEEFESAIQLFEPKILRLLRGSYKRSARKEKILWDLLQSKDLSAKVPDCMIQAAYEKHMGTLSSVGETPSKVLAHLRPYFRLFAEHVSKYFSPTTTLPPGSAYFHSKRSSGGCRGWLKTQKCFSAGGFEPRHVGEPRIDPVVFHLIGKPGVGKSFITTHMIKELTRRFGCLSNDYYSRSIATKHWDGYRGQLISVVDDVFQMEDDSKDISELMQICSNVETVLPMAAIEEKGRKFTSDFLFLSSNAPWAAGTHTVRSRDALFRRIYPAWEVLERVNGKFRIRAVKDSSPSNGTGVLHGNSTPGAIREFPNIRELCQFLCDHLISTHRSRRHVGHLVQPILEQTSFGEPGLSVRFPILPPEGLPKVMACAIPEPLKVRIITKGHEFCWILKPVQKAMWRALQDFPCFKLTGTPDIPLDTIASWPRNQEFLSGDYESATDNLNMDIMLLAVDELKKVLPSVYHSWLDWEGGPHEIHYPPNSKLSPIIQSRGQLMGSLLSFPILCVANAATVGIVKKIEDLAVIPALINGDDILFKARGREIKSWRSLATCMGLKPSIGKNYRSFSFGSINSQLITQEEKQVVHSGTGSFGATGKISNYLQCLREALRIDPDNKPHFVKIAKPILKKTPQSVDIPTEFGGLGFEFTKVPNLRDKEIYFFKLLRKTCRKVLELDDMEYWHLPKHLVKRYGSVLGLLKSAEVSSLDTDEDQPDIIFPWREFDNFRRWYKTVPLVRERIWGCTLQNEMPLSLFTNVCVRIPKSSSKIVENIKMRL